jgi:hypothetical protein
VEGEEGGMDGAGVLFNVFLTFLHCFVGMIGILLEFQRNIVGILLEFGWWVG